jgi:hypothetical protein
MTTKLSDFRISIRQLFLLAVILGLPYGTIGLIWALTHSAHLSQLQGLDKILSFLGEIAAWPVLIFADITLK